MTIHDKTNGSKQKYCLTAKGCAFLTEAAAQGK